MPNSADTGQASSRAKRRQLDLLLLKRPSGQEKGQDCSGLLHRQQRRPFAAEPGAHGTAAMWCEASFCDSPAQDLAHHQLGGRALCGGKAFQRCHQRRG